MADLKLKLQQLVTHWRSASEQARHISDGEMNLLARGHLLGMADGLDVAAHDTETLLKEMDKLEL